MSENKPLKAEGFIEHLKALLREGRNGAITMHRHRSVVTVLGDVVLEPKMFPFQSEVGSHGKGLPTSLSLDDLNLSGHLTISGWENCNIYFRSCNLEGSLRIEDCGGSILTFHNVSANHVEVFRGKFQKCRIGGLKTRILEIGGLTIEECLHFYGNEYERCDTHHERVSEISLKAKVVKTDDPVLARQCELAHIPVHVHTDTARQMLASSAKKALTSLRG